MNHKLTYKNKLASNTSLAADIDKLIQEIVNQRKFTFNRKELNFDTSGLESNQIIHLNEGKFEITDSSLFFHKFCYYYSKKISFTLSNDVDEALVFMDKVSEEFSSIGYTPGISSFFRNFTTFMLFAIHQEFNLDFREYIKGLNKETSQDKLYKFNSPYCNIVPYLQTTIEIIYENLFHLLNEVTDETVRFNANVGEIRIALTEYCKSNIQNGLQLLTHSLQQNPVSDNLCSAILQGIYQLDKVLYWQKVEEISTTPKHRLSVIVALSSTEIETAEEAKNQFNLINSFINLTEAEQINLFQFYQNRINSDVVELGLKTSCFAKIEGLIIDPNQNIRQFVLLGLPFIKKFDSEKIDLLKKLVLTADFDKQQFALFGKALMFNKFLKGFSELTRVYALKYRLDFDIKIFESIIYNFENDQPEAFSLELIQLLTDDQGEIRYFGNRILSYLTPLNDKFLFKTEITKLTPLTQFKLLISTLSDIREPQSSLPMLIPILYSSSTVVREKFISKLELLSEEYGSSVIETLEAELDLNASEEKKIYDRIRVYCDNFWSQIKVKKHIKEFNPLYAESELYTLHSKNYGKKINQELTENIDKNSVFAQFAHTVILAKGGGWKHGETSKVEQLPEYSAKLQLPRSYFIAPESYNLNFTKRRRENWKDKSKEWEAAILLYESI